MRHPRIRRYEACEQRMVDPSIHVNQLKLIQVLLCGEATVGGVANDRVARIGCTIRETPLAEWFIAEGFAPRPCLVARGHDATDSVAVKVTHLRRVAGEIHALDHVHPYELGSRLHEMPVLHRAVDFDFP